MKTKLFVTALFFTASFLTTKAQFTKIFDFDSIENGDGPYGSLISDGTFLYGMTNIGGTNNLGVIFKVKPDGTGYAKLLDFNDLNGSQPLLSSLISDGIFFYGMTERGGANHKGVIFKIKPDGTGYAKLLDFAGDANGSYPNGSLISDGIFLYGMTNQGGTSNMGTIFKIKTDGSEFVKLLDFTAQTGGQTYGSLISDGTFLYGMTYGLGFSNLGILFKIKTDGTGFTKLLDFTIPSDGQRPFGSLIFDGSFLYGMTWKGGTSDKGVLFKIKPDGTGYVKLLDFDGAANGSFPYSSLTFDGTSLYGMTSQGGTYDKGVLFKIKPDGTGYVKLLDFDGDANGSYPRGSLISDGTFLYGMTTQGGANDYGTIFRYALATGMAEHSAESGFNVYPNPTSGMFTIEMDGREGTKGDLFLHDILGQVVHQQTLKSKLETLNLNLPGGVYFLHITTEQGMASRKIVVRQ